MSGEFPPSAALFVKKLGQAIARKRVVEGMLEIELADAVGLSVDDISDIEAGRYPMRLDMLGPIGNALNVEPGELLVLAGLEKLRPEG